MYVGWSGEVTFEQRPNDKGPALQIFGDRVFHRENITKQRVSPAETSMVRSWKREKFRVDGA